MLGSFLRALHSKLWASPGRSASVSSVQGESSGGVQCELVEILEPFILPKFILTDETGVQITIRMKSLDTPKSIFDLHVPLNAVFGTSECTLGYTFNYTWPIHVDICDCEEYSEGKGHGMGWRSYIPEMDDLVGAPSLGASVSLEDAIEEWLEQDTGWEHLNPLSLPIVANRLADAAWALRSEMVGRGLLHEAGPVDRRELRQRRQSLRSASRDFRYVSNV